MRLAVWRLTSLNGGERPKHLTLDIDWLPIEVHGHQGGSDYHGHVGSRIYSPLIASLAETGDLLGGLLREGNAGPAENADTPIPHLVRRLNETIGARVRVRIDAASPHPRDPDPWSFEAIVAISIHNPSNRFAAAVPTTPRPADAIPHLDALFFEVAGIDFQRRAIGSVWPGDRAVSGGRGFTGMHPVE